MDRRLGGSYSRSGHSVVKDSQNRMVNKKYICVYLASHGLFPVLDKNNPNKISMVLKVLLLYQLLDPALSDSNVVLTSRLLLRYELKKHGFKLIFNATVFKPG
jgi:hypothetical protein